MPCMCWYDPPEESKRMIKQHCQMIVDEIKRLEKEGDPYGVSINHTKELLDHLYRPESCKEKDLDKAYLEANSDPGQCEVKKDWTDIPDPVYDAHQEMAKSLLKHMKEKYGIND